MAAHQTLQNTCKPFHSLFAKRPRTSVLLPTLPMLDYKQSAWGTMSVERSILTLMLLPIPPPHQPPLQRQAVLLQQPPLLAPEQQLHQLLLLQLLLQNQVQSELAKYLDFQLLLPQFSLEYRCYCDRLSRGRIKRNFYSTKILGFQTFFMISQRWI